MLFFRVYPENESPPPGPTWEPVVYDGKFPLTSDPGDIYINRYKDPPLYYVFTKTGNCELVSREEIKEWVTGGKMKSPTPVPKSSLAPSTPGKKPSATLPAE